MMVMHRIATTSASATIDGMRSAHTMAPTSSETAVSRFKVSSEACVVPGAICE